MSLNTVPPSGGADGESHILSFEATCERERWPDLGPAGLARHPVEPVASGVGALEVERRRDDATADREGGDGDVERARAADEVAGGGLDAARGDLWVVAEHGAERVCLARIPGAGSTSVRRDVVDVGRSSIGLAERRLDRNGELSAFGIGRDQLPGVIGVAETDDLRVDARPAGGCGLGGLEHEEGSPLPEHGAAAIDVIGTAGGRAEVVPLGEDPDRVELGHVPPGAGIVEAAGDGDVGLATADGAIPAADRDSAGLRSAGEVRVRPLQRVGLGDVEDRRGLEALHVEERVERRRRLLAEPADVHAAVLVPRHERALEDVHRVRDLLVAPDEQAQTVAVLRALQAGVGDREGGARERELVVAGHRAQDATVRELLGIEIRDVRRELRPQRGRVVARDRRDAALSLDEAGPGRLGADTERRDEADAGDDDLPHEMGLIRSCRARVTTLPSTRASPLRTAPSSVRSFSCTEISIWSPGWTKWRKPTFPAPASRHFVPVSFSSRCAASEPMLPRIRTPGRTGNRGKWLSKIASVFGTFRIA